MVQVIKNKLNIQYGYFLLVIPAFFILKYYYTHNPEIASGSGFFPSCPFHYLTGLHCPGCGSQRAIHDLLHARFMEAFSHNLLFLILIVFIISQVYYHFNKIVLKRESFNLSHNKYFTYFVLFTVISYWILRNIPYSPFIHLAP